RRGIPLIGIGHQYAFRHKVPTRGDNALLRGLMRWYAPATLPVGLHWHHFNAPILPPIVDLPELREATPVDPGKVIVYLPLEAPQAIFDLVRDLRSHQFHVYHPELRRGSTGNIHCSPLSRAGFKQDLLSAGHVICNSGFELISEA